MFSPKLVVIILIFATNAVGLSASEFKDPTEPPKKMLSKSLQAAKGGKKKHLRVTSIMISEIGRHASVNGVIVRKGDSLAGGTVTEIRPGWVELKQRGKHRKLFLIPRGLKKIARNKVN